MDRLARILGLNSVTPTQVLTLVAQILTGFAGFGTAIASGGWAATTLASTVLVLTIALTADKLAKFRFENETSEKLQRLHMQKNDLEYIGGIVEGVNEAIAKCKNAIYVKNTLFNRTNPLNMTTLGDYFSIAKKVFTDSIAQGCNWTEAYVDREKAIVEQNLSALNRVAVKGSYRPIMINSSESVLQVLLIKISNTDHLVLFGWTLESGEYSRVYRSSDVETFRYFERYFDDMVTNLKVKDQPNLTRLPGPKIPTPN